MSEVLEAGPVGSASTTGSVGAWIAAAVVPVLLFLALYARSLPYEFVWTDRTEIVAGLVIRPPGHIAAAFAEPMYPPMEEFSPGSSQPYYRPVKVVLASLVDHAFGREPAAFRSVNLAAGALTFALFALLGGALFGDPRAAGLAAALAAVHPVGIESYVWIAGLDDALAKLFVVASLLATVLAARCRGVGARLAAGAAALVLLALALGSKESSVVAPVLAAACLLVLPAAARSRLPQASARWTAVGLVGSQVVLVALYWLVLRPAVLGGFGTGTPPIDGSYAVHLLTVLSTWPSRVTWLFVPRSATTSDVVSIVRVVLTPANVLAVLLAGSAPFVFLRLRRTGHGMAALGWIWLWIAFVPTSGLVPLTHVRAERHMALSSFGAAFVVAAVVSGLAGMVASRWRAPRAGAIAWAALALLLVGGLSLRTSARIPDWRSDLVLFARDVARDPLDREGRYVLANALAEAGRPAEAHQQLIELAAVNDRFRDHSSFLRQDGAVRLLCEVNLELGQEAETLRLLGAQIRPDSPALRSAPAFFLCGARTLEHQGRLDDALALYDALHALPDVGDDPHILLGLARANELRGRTETARSWLQRTPETVPGDPAYASERRDLAAALGVH